MTYRRTLVVLAIAAASIPVALGSQLVVPNALANVEGNGNNTIPVAGPWQRYQQVYASNQFSAGGPLLLITGMRFRQDGAGAGSPFTETVNWHLQLSTTSAAPDALSTTFASNTGANVQTVYNGNMTLTSTATTGVPRPFDIVVNFSTPFLYAPGAGNLLWDVTRFSTNGTFRPMDSEGTQGDSISRVIGTNPTDTVGIIADTHGLITQFEYTAVPEPASMVALGVGALALIRRRRR